MPPAHGPQQPAERVTAFPVSHTSVRDPCSDVRAYRILAKMTAHHLYAASSADVPASDPRTCRPRHRADVPAKTSRVTDHIHQSCSNACSSSDPSSSAAESNPPRQRNVHDSDRATVAHPFVTGSEAV